MSTHKTLEKTENKILPLIQYEGADQGRGWRIRFFLWVLKRVSFVYTAVVQCRLWLYDVGIIRRFPLGCQVISVGNVTVGGTGKTPVVEMLARELQRRGRRVAILSRGYRKREKTFWEKVRDWFASGGGETPPRVVTDGKNLLLDSEMSGDEPYMLANNLSGVVVLVDKNRVKSGRYAVRRFGCDTLVLDDGFQYQRLKHRLDLVLVDRTNPFGNGNVLPRGILREPARNIRRARFICITKAAGGDTSALRQKLRELNPEAGIMECNHVPCNLTEAFTRIVHPLSMLKGMRVVALSGIASPRSFEQSLRDMGAEVVECMRFADHHRFSQQEVIDFVLKAQKLGADAVVTTEKDAVRMTRIDRCAVPVFYVRIEVRFTSGIEEFNKCIGEITFEHGKHPAFRGTAAVAGAAPGVVLQGSDGG